MKINDKYYTYAINQMARAKKEKKKANGYKNKPDRICFYDDIPCAERHEVFGGANRKTSIAEGFQVDVSPDRHRELHENITDWAKKENEKWKICYQQAYIDVLMEQGITEQMAMRYWMNLIGKNYLDVIPE